MLNKAQFKSGEDLIESETITLNTNTDTIEAGDPSGNSRVRMVIQPNNTTGAQ